MQEECEETVSAGGAAVDGGGGWEEAEDWSGLDGGTLDTAMNNQVSGSGSSSSSSSSSADGRLFLACFVFR